MATDTAKHQIQFLTDAPGVKGFEVVGFKGVEDLARPYRFEIELVSPQTNVKLEDMVRHACRLAVKQAIPGSEGKRFRTAKIHGVLSAFEQLDQLHDGVHYRAVLVPRLWRLGLTVQSRVFLDKTFPEILKEVLEAEIAGRKRFTSSDYELKLSGTYRKREFVLQYQESDLDFLSRWIEHQGIFYYFEQTDQAEKIVFADNASAYALLPGDPKIPYRAAGGARGSTGDEDSEGAVEEAVRSLVARQSEVPSKVVLQDYNSAKPTSPLRVEETVDAKDEGMVYRYGEDYLDQGEGKALAKIRAEGYRCGQRVFHGRSDCRSLRAGVKITLKDHYREDFNGSPGYVVTRVEHAASQPQSGAGGSAGGATYANAFTCIPASITFRPARVTPWPKVPGVLHGIVDASGDGQYAEIDDQGRYKVKLPLDLSDRKDGKASHYVRKSEQYAGGGMGNHMPLHKGTEVILTCENGDPDRLIIANAVPNPDTASPVSGPNQTQSMILTGGGNKIVLEDQDGQQQILIVSPVKGTQMTMGHDPEKPGFNASTGGFRKTDVGADDLLTVNGNQESTVMGTRTDTVNGTETRTVVGNVSETFGASRTTSISANDTCSVGANDTFNVGANRTESIGANDKLNVGANKDMTIAAKFVVNAGAQIKLGAGGAFSNVAGAKYGITSGGPIDVKGGSKITAQSSGPTNIKAGAAMNLQSGAATNIKAGGPLNAQAPTVSVKGTTKIKGKTTITGATTINGATKVKGATQVQGSFKVKGTTFTVS